MYTLFLIQLVLVFNVFAHTEIESLTYQYYDKKYFWAQNVDDDQINLKLHDRSDLSKTNIHFSWQNNIRIGNNSFDQKRNVISPKPGRELWYPHPTSAQSLEEIFIKSMIEIGYPKLQIPYLKTDQNNIVSVSTIDDFLNEYKRYRPNIDSHTFLKNLKKEIVSTTNELIFDKNYTFKLVPDFFNIIQPIKSGKRYDAFNMLPVVAYLKEKESFNEEINFWLKAKNLNVFKMLKIQSASKRVKHALLALLTHNHLIEQNLIKLIAITDGPAEAWKMAKNINELYKKEQIFWMKRNEGNKIFETLINKELLDIFYKTNFAPYNEFITNEVNLGFINRYCTKGSSELKNILEDSNLPVFKSYHLYGSLLLALNMKNLKIPFLTANKISQYFIQKYKVASGSSRQSEIAYLRQLYSVGVHYVYDCN